MEKHWEKVLELRKNLSSKDVDHLLKPINRNNPSGEYLLYNDTYDQIRNARVNEDKNIPRGVWIRPLKEADWNTVEQICTDALAKKTKDLQIAAWLLEAWFYKYQTWGLLQGLILERKLITTFWDSVYPHSNDDPEYRLAPLEWLNKKFVANLTLTQLTLPESTDAKFFTYGDYLTLSYKKNHLKINETKNATTEATASQLKNSLEDFKKSQMQTNPGFYKSMISDVDACLKEVATIEEFISSKLKGYAGCLNHLRTQLQNFRHTTSLLQQETDQKQPQAEANISKSNDDLPKQDQIKSKKETTMPAKGSPAIKISNRQQAYDQLREIADQLAKIEPHSPTPYMIRKAVAWGEMSLAEVMKELSQDGGDILKMMRLLGIDQNTKQQ
jgi:type VI secretion system ImpA family protein